jgi:hypothetical protein
MTPRLCIDCGIPPWADCQCCDDAGLDHPENPYIAAERRRHHATDDLTAARDAARVRREARDLDENEAA